MPLQTIHRPQSLAELYGNESVVDSLTAVLGRTDDKPHAYLFTGNAGTGKTTCARIIKEMLKCADTDYYQYNAANTRGIDAIRDIQDNCQFAPMSGLVKLFQLEECHQLTTPAQESLLVLLEEPPDHVYFVLCTTEPGKLKASLKRRCHSYELKPLNTIEMNKLLNATLQKEGITTFPDDVINKIISVSDGSPGKALNLLDTVIDVPDDAQAFKIIEDASVSEASISDIMQAILFSDARWSTVAEMADHLTGEPETIRRAFLGYLGKVLSNPRNDPYKTVMVMREFKEPVFNTGKPGLKLEIFEAYASIR